MSMRERSSSSAKRRRLPGQGPRPREVSGLYPLAREASWRVLVAGPSSSDRLGPHDGVRAVVPGGGGPDDLEELEELDADAYVEIERTPRRFERTQLLMARLLAPAGESVVDDESVTEPNGIEREVRERTQLFRGTLMPGVRTLRERTQLFRAPPRERTQLFRGPPSPSPSWSLSSSSSPMSERSTEAGLKERTEVRPLREIIAESTEQIGRRLSASHRTRRAPLPRGPMPWQLLALAGAALLVIAALLAPIGPAGASSPATSSPGLAPSAAADARRLRLEAIEARTIDGAPSALDAALSRGGAHGGPRASRADRHGRAPRSMPAQAVALTALPLDESAAAVAPDDDVAVVNERQPEAVRAPRAPQPERATSAPAGNDGFSRVLTSAGFGGSR